LTSFETIPSSNSTQVKTHFLGDIATIQTGEKPTEGLFASGADFAYLNGGVSPSGFVGEANTPGETIAIPSRGSVGKVAWSRKPFWCGPLSYRIRPLDKNTLSTRFLYFYLKNLEPEIVSLQQSGSIPALNKAQLSKVIIELPPINVQNEIVGILDTFLGLEVELEAELKARSRQLASIKDSLFRGDLAIEEHCELGDLAELWLGRTKAPLTTANYVSVENLGSNFGGRIDAKSVPRSAAISYQPRDILIGNIRPYLKKIWFADREGGSSADVLTVRLKPGFETKVLHRYLFHVLASDRFFDFSMAHAKGAKMPRGSKDATFKFLVPLPPISTQSQIVLLMDQLETLISDTAIGLPAEIDARRKQYEHYRDLLLAFRAV
jgi:type I restriction enzyme S subunit